MRDFADRLDAGLRALDPLTFVAPNAAVVADRTTGGHRPAAADDRDASTKRAHRRPRPGRRLATLGGVGALSLIAGSTTLISGTSAASLEVLNTPTSNASELAASPSLRRAGVDFRRAHVIRTDHDGSATVLVSKDGRTTCIAIPDPEIAGTGGTSCAATAKIEHAGLLVEMIGVRRTGQPAPRSTAVFILPLGATNPRLHEGTQDRAATVVSGVVLVSSTSSVRLRFGQFGATRSIQLAGVFASEDRATCHGHTYAVHLEPGSTVGGAPGHLPNSDACDVRSDAEPG